MHNIPEKMVSSFELILKDYSHLLVENERSMNKLFDYISDSDHIKDLFSKTLQRLEEIGNSKASVRLEIRLAKVLLQNHEYVEFDPVLYITIDLC